MAQFTDYSSILDNRVKTIYPVTSANVPEEYSKYTNKVDERQYQYTVQGITGLSMGEIIADGQVPGTDAPIQGFSKTYTQAIFTKRVRFTKQAYYYLFQAKNAKKIDENVKKDITDLKNSIVWLKNYYAQSLLANGFATSFTFSPIGGFGGTVTVDTTGIDGVAYWSASHPREDGGTAWSNLVFSGTNNPVFSFTSLLAARSQHVNKKDGRGLPLLGSSLDTLLVQDKSQAYHLAMSIKKTLSEGKYPSANPGTSGSFVDAAPTDSFEIIPLMPFGTTSTGVTSLMWFMLDKSMIKDAFGLQYIQSMDTELSDVVTDYVGNMDLVATATEYCQIGGADMRYWMASNGTGS